VKDFAVNMRRAREAFSECVRQPLMKLLAAEEILSIEDDAPNSTISALLDQAGTSDLLLNYRKEGLILSAASRISFVTNRWKAVEAPNFSMPLGNAKAGKTGGSELNRLYRAVQSFGQGIPVVLPRFLCMAQVDERGSKPVLLELLAVETIPLIRTLFDRSGVNVPALRDRFAIALRNAQVKASDDAMAACVHLNETRRDYAGIRANNRGDSFFFFTRDFLDDQALPYRRFTN
jgi:hypothetical protein